MLPGNTQVFCDVCSRGVTLNWEHIYRCRLCGKHVCIECFRPELKLCAECDSDVRKSSEYDALKAATMGALSPEERKLNLRKRRLQAQKWMVAGPLVICAGTAVLWLIYPKTVFWVTIAIVHSLMSIFAGVVRYPWKEA
jgi:hypothetical protein